MNLKTFLKKRRKINLAKLVTTSFLTLSPKGKIQVTFYVENRVFSNFRSSLDQKVYPKASKNPNELCAIMPKILEQQQKFNKSEIYSNNSKLATHSVIFKMRKMKIEKKSKFSEEKTLQSYLSSFRGLLLYRLN